MLAIAIIVFREVLEAALIVGIVLAASVGIAGRVRWVLTGIAGGVLGALLVAVFAASIAGMFAGSGQELLNATVLLLAVVMLGWHNLWMASHAREMAASAREVGREVAAGRRPLAALALICGAAVLREGSETVLFVFGVVASSPEGPLSLALGGLLGLLGGFTAGAALYLGLLRIPLHLLFRVTSWMVLLLAAGLASQAVGFLVQADLLPALGESVWDTSAFLSDSSIVGRVLHTLVGYVAQPEGIQLIAFAATLLIIGVPMRAINRPHRVASVTAVLLAGVVGLPNAARADLKVRMPTVEYREFEFENNGLVTFDRSGSPLNRAQSYTNEIGYGVLPWWLIELEGEMQSGGGEHLNWSAVTLENTFQLTQPGEYFFNWGFFAEYSRATLNGTADSVTAGPIVQKELNNVLGVDSLHTINLFLSHDVGHFGGHETGFEGSWQSVVLLHPMLAPGFEYYSLIGDIANAGPFNRQQHLVGPVLTGVALFAPYGKIRYEAGYLVGLTSASPRGALRWRLEYEIAF
ncbi:MAG: FTR1 family protein [Acetobacteraceae bacterium]|nr:FTR1 family protein [Acetobacteraceae bacterium]